MHRTEVERIVESQDWTPTGDWTFTGTVTFSGSSAETFESIIVDGTSAEALLIRKDSDGGDVLTVNTTDSKITFGGAIACSSGSLALPGISFDGDPDTGIYRTGGDGWRGVAGGTDFFELNETSQDVFTINPGSRDIDTKINWDEGTAVLVTGSSGVTTFARARDDASNEIVKIEGNSRTTPADNDEAYFSYMLEADDGNQNEVGRMNWVFSDVTLGSMQSRFSWEVLKGASLTEALSVGSDVSGNLEVRLPNDDQPLMQGAADDYKQEWDGTNEVYTISSGNFIFTGGNIGLGVDAVVPSAKLTVESSATQLRLQHTGQSGTANQTASFAFSDSGTNSLNISTDYGGGTQNRISLMPGYEEVLRLIQNGNVGINTTTFDGTAAKVLAIGNGTAPGAGTTNQAYLYCISGEMKVMDSAGNETLLSPHDAETGDWIFFSQNKTTGRKVRINMERMIRKLEQFTGESFIETDGV
jgi:hypothetical protein